MGATPNRERTTMTDKIKQIGRDECKMIRELVNMALEDALSDLGLKASIGNMTFDYETVSSKLTIAIEELAPRM